jgi:hypothetical protein
MSCHDALWLIKPIVLGMRGLRSLLHQLIESPSTRLR